MICICIASFVSFNIKKGIMASLYLEPVIIYYAGKKTGRVDFDYRRRRVLVYQYKGIEF